MTAHKSFKRLVRARMAKTGESYAAARSQLLAGAQPAPDQVGVPELSCSDARIRERTGMGWEEWFELLDSWDAEQLAHKEIARRVADLRGSHILSWDAQAVATSFERSRGMRAVGERCGPDGFVASASKTIAAPAVDVFRAVVDASWRAGWLGDLELVERRVNKPKSARFDVEDGRTRLLVTIAPKAADKATIAVEQSRLAGPDELEQQRTFWRTALVALKDDLEGNDPKARGAQPVAKKVAKKAAKKVTKAASAKGAKPKLLSSGNPQIPKGEGDGPVQAYIAAMPGWKHDVGRRLDELVEGVVPDVAKAVKWNSPLYGREGDGWFLSLYCYAKKVQVAFLRGTSLQPVPPGESKTPETRYLDIFEDDVLDEKQFTAWVKQASKLPGEHL